MVTSRRAMEPSVRVVVRMRDVRSWFMFVGLFVVGTCAVPVKEWLF